MGLRKSVFVTKKPLKKAVPISPRYVIVRGSAGTVQAFKTPFLGLVLCEKSVRTRALHLVCNAKHL